MKHLAAAVAALFLFAAPGAALAQDSNGSNNGNAGANDTTSSTSKADEKGADCAKLGPAASFDSFSEECRREINMWIQKQGSAGIDFKGDVAVGAELPGDVEFIEVPSYRDYGYARLNGKDVLIDRETRRVVHVF